MFRYVVGAVALALLAIGAGLGSAADDKAAPAPVPVRVAKVEPSSRAGLIIVSGTVAWKREQVLSFKTGGVVRSYAVDNGDTVRKGAPLVSADPADTTGRRAEAEAAYAAASANLERNRKLFDKGFVSQARLDDARAAHARASAALGSARFDESRAALVAPSDGVVLLRHAEIGQQMAPGAPVITIGDTTSGMILRAPLGDREVVRVRKGDTATLRLAAGAITAQGKVTRIGARSNPLTGAFDVEITLDTVPDGARSGLVAEATLNPAVGDASQQLLAVPAIALIEGQGDAAYVYVISPDAKASRVAITIAGFTGDSVLVKTGLKPGDRVATSGAAYLRNGQPVTIEGESPATPAPRK
jgi:RND family efflux transporter MFP subunit